MDFNTVGSFDNYASAIAAATPKELNEGHLLRRLAIVREGPLLPAMHRLTSWLRMHDS